LVSEKHPTFALVPMVIMAPSLRRSAEPSGTFGTMGTKPSARSRTGIPSPSSPRNGFDSRGRKPSYLVDAALTAGLKGSAWKLPVVSFSMCVRIAC